MTQDPLFQLPKFKSDSKFDPALYRGIVPIPPSYRDLAPSRLGQAVEMAQNPLLSDETNQTLGGRTVSMISKGLAMVAGIPITDVMDAPERRRLEYQSEQDMRTIERTFRPLFEFSQDMSRQQYDMASSFARDPEELEAIEGIFVPPATSKNFFDPLFDWTHRPELWDELKSQLPVMYHDNLLNSRSEKEAREYVQGINASLDYEQAWEMWYNEYAQDTLGERLLTYPKIGRVIRDLSINMLTDPITWTGIGASVRISNGLSKYIRTAKLAKFSRQEGLRTFAAWGAATTAEVGVGLAAAHAMALRDGTTENDDQYISAILFAGTLGGFANSWIAHAGIRNRIARYARYNEEVIARRNTQIEVERGMPGYTAKDIVDLKATNPEAYDAAMDEVANDTVINQLRKGQTTIDPLADPERFKRLVQREKARRDKIIDKHKRAAEAVETQASVIALANDISSGHMENVFVAGLLDDIGVPTTLGDDVATTRAALDNPKVQRTQVAEDADDALGPAFRVLLQGDAFQSENGMKLRNIIMKIMEGRPAVLDLSDVRVLAKESPEVLSELDLPQLMKRVANKRKANKQLAKAKKLQSATSDAAQYNNVTRRAVPKKVGDVIISRDGRVGQVINVSASGRTVTVDYGFIREKALRKAGQIPRPDVRKLQKEVQAAEAALEGKQLTATAKNLMNEVEARANKVATALRERVVKVTGRLETIDSKITMAEGRLETAQSRLKRFKDDEAKRTAGGIEPRPKALAAAEERVKKAEASIQKLTSERETALETIKQLEIQEQAAKTLDIEVPVEVDGKTTKQSLKAQAEKITNDSLAQRQTELEELRELLEQSEAAEEAVYKAQRDLIEDEAFDQYSIPDLGGRSRYNVDEYEVETGSYSSVATVRADQVGKFVLDDPLGQELFPSTGKWESGKSAAKVVYKGINRESKKRRPIEYHTTVNGFRTTLRRVYERTPKGEMRQRKGTAAWSVTFIDLDGRTITQTLEARTLKAAKDETAVLARKHRVDSMVNPERSGVLIGQAQAVRTIDMFEGPNLVEDIADGIIPAQVKEAQIRPKWALYDTEFIGNAVDADDIAVGFKERTDRFKQLAKEEIAAKKQKSEEAPTPKADDAPLTDTQKADELEETATVQGAGYLRLLGMFGVRGNGLASRFNTVATAFYEILGGAGVALKYKDKDSYAPSGTGVGTLGAGGYVPQRRALVYRNLAPIALKFEEALYEYSARAGRGVKNPKDELNRDVYRYRTEGVVPDDPRTAQIVKNLSDTFTNLGFNPSLFVDDPMLKGLVDELEGIKNSPNYVMRVRNKNKFKQIEKDMTGGSYWDDELNDWVYVTDGVDFINLNFERMLLEGNPKLTHSAPLMAKRMVQFYMSDSDHALKMLDDMHGKKYQDAKEFVDEFERVLQDADDHIASQSKFGKPDGEKLNFFEDKQTKAEFLTALRKDLGQTQKKIRITMPRLKLGNSKMKVKFKDGTIREDIGQLDYFEHDFMGLISRYHTEVYGRAGMKDFLRRRATDSWQPQEFREYKEAMIRSAKRGDSAMFESDKTVARQLNFLENALLARPQYSRFGGVGHLLQTLSNLSTLRALPGFVPAQAPEMASAGYANGYAKVLRRIPALGELIDDAAMGRLSYENASTYVNIGLGMGMNENRIPSMFASIDHVENASPIARKVAGETYPIQVAGKINEWSMENIPKASRWSLFAASQNFSDIVAAQELHNVLVQIARTGDPAKRAARLDKFAGRKDVRLGQFGISRKDFEEVIEALRQDGAIISENVNGLEFTNIGFDHIDAATRGKLDDMFRSWIKYYVQRSDDYSMPMLFATSELGKITQQFRQFAWGSNLNHMGRSLQAMDTRALTAVVNQIVFGAITHVGLGYMRFWNDPERLKEYMSAENIIKGIIMRSAFFGMGVDVVDTGLYALGQDTLFSRSGTPMSMSLPALQTGTDLLKGGGAILDTAFGDGLTERNFARMKRLTAPFDKWLPMELLWPLLEEGMGVE